MSCLFALDQGFPLPIVKVLGEYQADAELVSFSEIDSRLQDLEDWEILLALHHHARTWDGLITTDSSMLNQAPELSTVAQTKQTLVVALGTGHDPVRGCPARRGTWWRPPGEFSQVREAVTSCVAASVTAQLAFDCEREPGEIGVTDDAAKLALGFEDPGRRSTAGTSHLTASA